ncbi:hypothetical protein [Mesonia sp.]|uniref:hypothetical protein n=1 Tax=Mesonia sp. TaxID=1960830 RepID=UPI003F9E04B9
MKLICFFSFLCIGFTTIAQDISGSYTSDLTSFEDNYNSENNFKETTKFNIAIAFEDKDTGSINIQDPRIPKKVLAYKVKQFLDTIERDETVYTIYQAVSQHTLDPIQTKVIF